jgi:hypothetical protein
MIPLSKENTSFTRHFRTRRFIPMTGIQYTTCVDSDTLGRNDEPLKPNATGLLPPHNLQSGNHHNTTTAIKMAGAHLKRGGGGRQVEDEPHQRHPATSHVIATDSLQGQSLNTKY